MSKIDLTVAHRFSRDEALQRAHGLLERIQKQFTGKISDLQQEWDGNTNIFGFSVMGFSVSGKLVVNPSEVNLTADLPFAAVSLQLPNRPLLQEGALDKLLYLVYNMLYIIQITQNISRR